MRTLMEATVVYPSGEVEEIRQHVLIFSPPNDKPGEAEQVVGLSIPETHPQRAAEILRSADRARIVVVCDTEAQAAAMLVIVCHELPGHLRVSVERAMEGGFGLVQ